MTTTDFLSGKWFKVRVKNYKPTYPKFYKFVATRDDMSVYYPGYIVEAGKDSSQSHHADVSRVDEDGTIRVHTFLMGEMIERVIIPELFDLAPEKKEKKV